MSFLIAADLKNWKQLDASSVKVDSSVSAFDIVHISRDIAEDLDKVRDWCLSGNVSHFFLFFFLLLQEADVLEPHVTC